ncbi:MAG: hypothetical protein ACRDF4_01205, partial [Rhabdochlamydiaceae bacterium]
YYAFYERSANASYGGVIQCTATTGGSVSISGGDDIFAEVINEAAYGSGYSNSLYDFYIYDSTSSTSCYSTGNSYPFTNPTIGAFIVENGYDCYNSILYGWQCASLAQFGSVTFSGPEIYTGSTYYTLRSLDLSGFDWWDLMQNHPGVAQALGGSGCTSSYVNNVDPGSVTLSNSFTATWYSSQYADFYQTGC